MYNFSGGGGDICIAILKKTFLAVGGYGIPPPPPDLDTGKKAKIRRTLTCVISIRLYNLSLLLGFFESDGVR